MMETAEMNHHYEGQWSRVSLNCEYGGLGALGALVIQDSRREAGSS